MFNSNKCFLQLKQLKETNISSLPNRAGSDAVPNQHKKIWRSVTKLW